MMAWVHDAPFSSSSSSSSSCFCLRHRLLFVLVAILVTSDYTTTLVVSQNDATDDGSNANSSAECLINFKSSLSTSSSSSAFESWNLSTSPCSGNNGNWFGVLCYDGDVWGLQLENIGLSGEIDIDSLIPLHFLRTLSFMNNSFKGSMPDWKKLGALKSLFLSNNSFSGQIPDDAFKGMSYLKKLYLSDNQFNGDIPTSIATSCPRLFELRLENNRFTGSIPDFPPGLLKLLNVSNNQLQGPIPTSLSFMDPTTFSGNGGLCGKPLESTCNISSPPAMPFMSPPVEVWKSSSLLSRIIMVLAVCLVVLCLIIVFIVLKRNSRDESANNNPQLGRAESTSYVNGEKALSSDQMRIVSGNANNYNSKAEAAPAAAGGVAGKLSFVRDDGPRFDLNDLLRASAEVLGSGNLGSSYKAQLMDGESVVVKRFKHMTSIGKEDFHEHMRRLGRLSHPNLLPLVAYYYRKEEKLLVFDYAPNGSLVSHLHGNHSRLDWPRRLKIIKGVAKGLAYLHNELPSLALPHGHLKSSNVLLDKSCNPILMDYALVPVINVAQVQHLLVAYKAPEYAQRGLVTRKTDVWSLGVLILETLTGKFPTNYLTQCTPGNGTDLASWLGASIDDEDDDSIFDKEMENTKGSQGQIRKLLQIGVACCQEDLDTRWDLKEVLEKIQELKEEDNQDHIDVDVDVDVGV